MSLDTLRADVPTHARDTGAHGAQPPRSMPPVEAGPSPLPRSGRVRPERPLDDAAAIAQRAAVAEAAAAAFEKGRQTGLAEGRHQGFVAAREELREEARQTALAAGGFTAERLSSLVTGFENELQALEPLIADRLVDLAIELARTLVGRAVLTDHDAAVHAVTEALAGLGAMPRDLRIRVHPDDLAAIESALARQRIEPLPVLVADPEVGPGGCIAESRDALVDARLATRWQRLIDALGLNDEPVGQTSGEER